MRSSLLLPHRFQLIGWLFFLPCLAMGLAVLTGSYSFDWLTITVPDWLGSGENGILSSSQDHKLNLTTTVSILSLLGSMGLIAFSRESVEDEMIVRLRLEALQWSLLVNYLLLGIATLLVYGFSYYQVLVFNAFTPLLVFILRFKWLLRRNGNLLAL